MFKTYFVLLCDFCNTFAIWHIRFDTKSQPLLNTHFGLSESFNGNYSSIAGLYCVCFDCRMSNWSAVHQLSARRTKYSSQVMFYFWCCTHFNSFHFVGSLINLHGKKWVVQTLWTERSIQFRIRWRQTTSAVATFNTRYLSVTSLFVYVFFSFWQFFHSLFIHEKCNFKCQALVAFFLLINRSETAINLFSWYNKFTLRKYFLLLWAF